MCVCALLYRPLVSNLVFYAQTNIRVIWGQYMKCIKTVFELSVCIENSDGAQVNVNVIYTVQLFTTLVHCYAFHTESLFFRTKHTKSFCLKNLPLYRCTSFSHKMYMEKMTWSCFCFLVLFHQTRDKILTLVNFIQNIQQLDDYVGLEVNILRHQADILGTDSNLKKKKEFNTFHFCYHSEQAAR